MASTRTPATQSLISVSSSQAIASGGASTYSSSVPTSPAALPLPGVDDPTSEPTVTVAAGSSR